MNDDKALDPIPQNCILENRKKLSVSGVTEVISFDEQTVSAETKLGELTVRGDGLHISHLSLETGDMCIEGSISAVIFQDVPQKNSGFFGRVFR